MKMSSQPSALRSSTLGPQGQYVSTPSASETSSKRPPPRLWKSALPKMKRLFPVGKKSAKARAESAYFFPTGKSRSEEHTSELQLADEFVCRLVLEKKNNR